MRTAKRKRITNPDVKAISFTDIEGNEHLLSQAINEDLIVLGISPDDNGQVIILDLENATRMLNYLKKVIALCDSSLN